MRNGLIKTLAAVAIACLGFQAFAVAPVINQIPSPVVTDDGNDPVSEAYEFVYNDWIDLRAYTTDDGDVNNLLWSYTSLAGRYVLNNAAELPDTLDATVINPPAGSVINSAANIAGPPAEFDPDGNANTVTIRDSVLSPVAGPNTPAGTSPGELLAMDSITLYASDGTTRSNSSTFVAYTEASGGVTVDRLSATLGPPPTFVGFWDFATSGAQGWTSSNFGTPATLTDAGNGLCIDVPAGGVNLGQWTSPYPQLNLVDNNVYRMRLTMTTTQNVAGAVPLWDIGIENIGGGASDQAYIGDYLFFDNTGSANAVMGPAQGRNDFEVWYTPGAVRTPQWRAFVQGGASDADDDAIVYFRILDTDASGGIGGELDSGTICLTDLTIDRFNLDDISSSLQLYNLNPPVSGINGVTVIDLLDNIAPGPGTGSNKDFLANPLTITPADAQGWLTELTFITPGDTNNLPISDPGYNPADSVDNYPIVWESDVLYELQVDASAPDATGENNGPDSLRLGFDAKTNEILGDSYMLSGYASRPGMPKQVGSVVPAGPQTYTMFWYSHNASVSPVAGAARLRWKVDLLNTTQYNRPTVTDTRNAGGTRLHAIRVNKVTFPGM